MDKQRFKWAAGRAALLLLAGIAGGFVLVGLIKLLLSIESDLVRGVVVAGLIVPVLFGIFTWMFYDMGPLRKNGED